MANMRRHRLVLATTVWLIGAVHAPAQSSSDDQWVFGSIESCGDEPRELPAAFVFPLLGGSCDEASRRDPRAETLLYLHYLNAGFRLAPVAARACKGERQECRAASRTVVLARSLTERAIADAITHRRVYVSSDRNMEVLFSINGHPLGSLVPLTEGTPLRIEVRLADPDEPSAIYWVSLRRDEVGGALEADREVSGTDLKGNGTIVFTQFQRRSADEFFLLEVTQGRGATEDVVWTAPIWLVSYGYAASDAHTAHGR